MTTEEKLQTEVITTEQAIYCMNHQYSYTKYECDYCPYCYVCEEKGIEGEMIKMAIKALEENEGLKAQIKEYEHDIRVLGAREEMLLIANKAVNEKIQKVREEIDELDGEYLTIYDGTNKLGYGKYVHIDDVLGVFDKHLGDYNEQ